MFEDVFQFFNPTRIIYGPGISTDFKTELQTLGVSKYFIVTDQVIRRLGIGEKITNELVSQGFEITGIFDKVPQDAEVSSVYACAKNATESNAEGLIAIGGGSVIDAAKAANILISEGGDLISDYAGVYTLKRPLKPLIAIPTTAGTGSEVTMVAVVYDPENKVKIPFTDRYLLPNLAVLDPELTLTLPPLLTASTAMDALTHAIEAYVGIQASPFSDALAVKAIELIVNHLITAVEDGSNIEARGALLVASNLAGIAFSHSMVGCVHGMAHALGGLFHVPHGIANAILLPYGMTYNLDVATQRLAQLAYVMGESNKELSVETAAQKAIDAVKSITNKLNKICNLPIRLRDVGIPEQALPQIAEATVMDGTCIFNPKEVVTDEILIQLTQAY